MTYYNHTHEKDRKRRETEEFIMHVALVRGHFDVSLRYRDDWLRRRVSNLIHEGVLRRKGSIDRGHLTYVPTSLAKLVYA